MKAPLSQLFVAMRSRPITLKMISFAMIGAGNALVDFGVFAFAYKLLMAVSGSYVANTLITFRTESGQILRRNDYLKFVASGILGVCAATTTVVVFSYYVQVFVAKTRVDSRQLWSELHDVAFYCVSPKSTDRFRVIE
jgi:hypothetical protein